MSIRVKIMIILLVIGVITSASITGYNYMEAQNRVFEDAYVKAELISSFAMASREYTKQTMRPLATQLAGKESFHPELMAGFYVVRSIADIFAESQKGYTFKQATLDPILPQNKSDAQETEIINYFNANRKTKIQKGIMNKNGQEFFYVARPVVNKVGCNRCHGRREDAPKEQLAKYPNSGGYNWRVGDVVATMITYVPLDATLARMNTTAMKTISAGLASVALLMLVTWYVMSKLVVKPLVHLTELAGDMSRGRGLDQEISGARNDEIGALCDSFNRMRKSVVNLIKIVKQKGD